eukprot:CAMPEP_0197571522 /NCGR_PEP_ID=MMETSP1320-20131121/41997_1 /TAXON_ID=91990 /ORGANISM="Bolidomonas sp., Strain RCC2347" /LENGTH=271 /DNA_ID=CAMNT_0043134015 /DNA_START=569 /DNA_END=1384 /DNA_ORIENTATION=+
MIWTLPGSVELESSFALRNKGEAEISADTFQNLSLSSPEDIISSLQKHLDASSNCSKEVYVCRESTSCAPLANGPWSEKFDELISTFQHVIVVHDPLETAVRLKREGSSVDANNTLDEGGFEDAYNLKHRIFQVSKRMPLCIDASSDLSNDLDKSLSRICSHAGISYQPSMAAWSKQRDVSRTLQKLRGWSDDNLVALEQSSNTFSYPKVNFRNDEEVIKYAIAFQPYYEAVLSKKLVKVPSEGPLTAALVGAVILNGFIVAGAYMAALSN